MSAELEARRTAAAAVLADYRRELNSAPLSRPPGREWMLRLADVLGDLLAALGQRHPAAEDALLGVAGQAIASQPGTVAGPFETEREAAAAVRHIHDAATPGRPGALTEGNVRLLEDTLHAAGVDLGKWDARILDWLAGWEPSTCAVVAGWVARAHRPELEEARGALLSAYEAPAVTLDHGQAATAADALEVAAEYRRYRASLTCEACAASPTEVCPDHEADLDRADEYDALARQITEATR
jgi:hypothetical protein